VIAIHPQYLTLSKLLAGRLFRIPEYQRAYSWTSKQRADLFGDIDKTHAKGKDAGHFMAATVCLRRAKQTLGTDEFQVLEVVDGQQRLTTLITLLKAIELAFDRDVSAETRLADEIAGLLIKRDGDELLLLQTNHDSSHHFETFLREGKRPEVETAKTLADQELLKAIAECIAYVDGWRRRHSDLSSLLALLKNRLHFLLHEIDEESAVYTVFEVLNSRGLDVSWIDRLKSILMGAAFDLKAAANKTLIKDLHTKWRDIYVTIGLRQGMSTEALRFAATLRTPDVPSRPMGEEASVELLRGQAPDAKGIRDVSAWLLKVVTARDAVAANPRINAVTRISQARLLAVSLHLRHDIKPKQRDELLGKWERVTFRIYGMLSNDARTRVGDYVRLAWRIINEDLAPKTIGRELEAIGSEFSIADAVDALRAKNCYEDWGEELRYFMYRYEEYLSKKNRQNFSNEQWERIWMASVSDSIEHIWAQSKAPEKSKHRLGNLVLLPPRLNSSLQSKEPSIKADDYRKTGLLIAQEVADVLDGGKWSSKAIVDREEALLKWAKSEWAD
jgi:hypothetical protein